MSDDDMPPKAWLWDELDMDHRLIDRWSEEPKHNAVEYGRADLHAAEVTRLTGELETVTAERDQMTTIIRSSITGRDLMAATARAEAAEAARDAARAEGLRMAADRFKALAEATPLGAENKERGASVYNWTRWAEKHVLALIPAPAKPPEPTLESVLSDLAKRQEPLGAEFEQALEAGREGLYEP